MTARELIDILQGLDPTMLVIICQPDSTDDEAFISPTQVNLAPMQPFIPGKPQEGLCHFGTGDTTVEIYHCAILS